MNKQKKRHISRGKFERVKLRAVRGMRVNCFDSYLIEDMKQITCFVNNGYMYWSELELFDLKPYCQYYRKSLNEALS